MGRSAFAAAVLTAGALIAMPGTSQAAGTLPCDIYDQTSRHNDLFIEPAGIAGPANSGVPPGTALPVA